MRNLLFIYIILSPFWSFAQEKMQIDSTTHKIYISAVREVPLSKEEIHRKVNYWIATHHKSAKEVTEFNSPELVVIRYTTVYRTMGKYTADFYNRMTIQIKDNKYKVTISDIENADPRNPFPLEWYLLKKDGSPKNRDYYENMVIDVREGTKARLQSLHRSIQDENLGTDF